MERSAKKEIVKSKLTIRSKKDSSNLPNLDEDNIYNLDEYTADELYDSLMEMKKYPVEPFAFLSDLLEEIDEPTEPTEIDKKLAMLKKRVELNRVLLENTHRYVKDAMALTEKNAHRYIKDAMVLTEKENCQCEGELNSTIQETLEKTLQILDYAKKISSGEMSFEELPANLIDGIQDKNNGE